MCPVCKIRRKIQTQVEYGGPLVWVDEPMYQYSYPGEKGYISPRCNSCYNKAERKMKRREETREAPQKDYKTMKALVDEKESKVTLTLTGLRDLRSELFRKLYPCYKAKPSMDEIDVELHPIIKVPIP